jgi:hypothetical protein
MAFKLIESAQQRWRAINTPHLLALVRVGATFRNGKPIERAEGCRARTATPVHRRAVDRLASCSLTREVTWFASACWAWPKPIPLSSVPRILPEIRSDRPANREVVDTLHAYTANQGLDRNIATGEGLLIAEFARRTPSARPRVNGLDGVTNREREVLVLIARGLSNP